MKRQHVYGRSTDDRFLMAKGPRKRRPYPDKKKRQMTPAWKTAVIAGLGRKDISEPQAAKTLGCDRKAIWQALHTDQQTSSLVEALSALAGVPLPLVESMPDDLELFVSDLTPEERQRAAAILRAALGDRVRQG